MTENWQKFTKKYFFDPKLLFTYLDINKGRPIYRESIDRLKENIQHLKTWTFLLFSIFVGIFFPLGSGSGFWIRSVSTDLIKFGSGSVRLHINSVHLERFVWYVIVISVTVFMKYRFKKLIPNGLSDALICFLAFFWQVLCSVMVIHAVTGSRIFGLILFYQDICYTWEILPMLWIGKILMPIRIRIRIRLIYWCRSDPVGTTTLKLVSFKWPRSFMGWWSGSRTNLSESTTKAKHLRIWELTTGAVCCKISPLRIRSKKF